MKRPEPPPSRLFHETSGVSSTAPRRERKTMDEEITITKKQLAAALTAWDAEALAGNWKPQPELTSEQRGAANADLVWEKLAPVTA